MDDNDAQLHLRKRARRRLVGAVFFVSVVAVVLPMMMDHEPRQTVQDVEIRIPGQDEKPFAPKFAVSPVGKPAEKPDATPEKEAVVAPEVKPTARVLEIKSADKPVEKPAPKPEKAVEKPAAKALEKSRADEAKRAAALLAGQSEIKPAARAGEYLVLIGAFSNEANVKTLKAKLSEQGIKTFSEPLDTPQGKKTRVRAGPFANRVAAEKALEKMQRIGVAGVVAAKP